MAEPSVPLRKVLAAGLPQTDKLAPPGHTAVSLALSGSSREHFCLTFAAARTHLHHIQGTAHPDAATLDEKTSVPEGGPSQQSCS